MWNEVKDNLSSAKVYLKEFLFFNAIFILFSFLIIDNRIIVFTLIILLFLLSLVFLNMVGYKRKGELNEVKSVVAGIRKNTFNRPEEIKLSKNLQALQEEIKQWLRQYIPNPEVSVSVKKIAGYKIFVIGRVNKPGDFVVGRYIDVLQALSLAGGLTPFAEEGNIKIVRKENGKEIIMRFNYAEVKKGRRLEQNITLQSGDVLIVP